MRAVRYRTRRDALIGQPCRGHHPLVASVLLATVVLTRLSGLVLVLVVGGAPDFARTGFPGEKRLREMLISHGAKLVKAQ